MEYGSTVLFVDSVSRTLEFYERAFGFRKKFFDQEYDFAIVDVAGSELGISSYHAGELMMPNTFRAPSNGHTEGVEVAFYTSDVVGAYERAVGAGASSMAQPKEMPWGQTVAYVKSPEGTIIGLCTPPPVSDDNENVGDAEQEE